MTSEAGLWQWLRGKASPGDRLLRVENVVEPGTADVWGMRTGRGFWCELKELDAFPVRPGTPVRFHRFTEAQAGFLTNVCLAGGAAWLLVQVKRERFLLWGMYTHPLQRGVMNQETFRALAIPVGDDPVEQLTEVRHDG